MPRAAYRGGHELLRDPRRGAEERETQMSYGSGSYTVDTAELSRHSGEVAGIAMDIQEAMTRMRRKLELLQGTWKGAAAAQYADLHAQWERQQESVRQTLDEIGRAAGIAGTNYARTEDEIAASFSTGR